MSHIFWPELWNWKKFARDGNSKCCSYLTFVVDTFPEKLALFLQLELVGRLYFPCLSSLLTQLIDFRIPCNVGLFDLISLFPIPIVIQRLMTVPATHVSIIMLFTFFIRPSESRFGRPFFSKKVFPFLTFFILIFQLLMDVLTRIYFK